MTLSEWDERYWKTLVERVAAYTRDSDVQSRCPLKLHIEDLVILMKNLGGYGVVRLDASGRHGDVFTIPFEVVQHE